MDHIGIVTRLRDAGFDAWLVGGAVRDHLLGLEPKDWDVATAAWPREIERIFADRKLRNIGREGEKSFDVYTIDGVEVATYRTDVDKNTATYIETINEDLARRDLTINSMAMWPVGGTIVDPFGGRKDLASKVIRFTGDPERRIKEDPLRMVRACRFLAAVKYAHFDSDTFDAIATHSYLIDEVPLERLGAETMKAMRSEYAGNYFRALQNACLLDHVFPTAMECVDHVGGGWHSETVFEHMCYAVDNVRLDVPELRLAAFLHDIGKPKAYRLFSNGSFKMHEVFGDKIARAELKRLRLPNSTIDYVGTLIRAHVFYLNDMTTDRGIRKHLLRIDGKAPWRHFVALTIADHDANQRNVPHPPGEYDNWVRRFERVLSEMNAMTVRDLKVNGRDVMAELGIGPGPEVGRVLQGIFDHVTDNPDLGTRDEQLALIRAIKESK